MPRGFESTDNLVLMNPSYPATVAVTGPNRETVKFFSELDPRPRMVAEIGCYQGILHAHLSRICQPTASCISTISWKQPRPPKTSYLIEEGWTNVVVHGNSSNVLDSYNWSLMKALAANSVPI